MEKFGDAGQPLVKIVEKILPVEDRESWIAGKNFTESALKGGPVEIMNKGSDKSK